jgi:AcrR family transcriptional regulator
MKAQILEVAWGLFLEKGYENTTVDEIINTCNISKGGFYHYFNSKDDLLKHLSTLLDKQYELLRQKEDENLSTQEKLIYYTDNLFRYIEDNIPYDILSRVLAAQIGKNGIKDLIDERRLYFSTLTDVISEGQRKKEIDESLTTREIVKLYALEERAILYDWCLCEGQYPLSTYGLNIFKLFIAKLISI